MGQRQPHPDGPAMRTRRSCTRTLAVRTSVRAAVRSAVAVALLTVLPLVGCGCEKAPILNAVGSYSDVAILTDLDQFNSVAFELQRALGIELNYGLRPEKMLKVDIFDLRRKDDAAIYKNVIVLGYVKGKDPASREIQRRLAGEPMKMIDPRGLFLTLRPDVYAQNQNVLFVAGRDRNVMQSAVVKQAAALRGQIEQRNRERVLEYLLAQGRDSEAEQNLARQAGFRLAIPTGYRLNGIKSNAAETMGCAEVVATRPTRSVVVFWTQIDPDAVDLADHEMLLAMRRQWGGFLEESLQDIFGFEWERVVFRGEEWPMLAGLYEVSNEVEPFGGPFRTIFVIDRAGRRLYGINWLTYFPNQPKHQYMREARAVAETFVPRS